MAHISATNASAVTMGRQNLARTAAIFAVSVALASCSGLDLGRMSNVSGTKAAQKSSDKSSKALAKGDTAKALMLSEAAVAADPNNADHRLALAQTYMAMGRFQSAETSFADALALGNKDGRAAIGLSLSLIANNKTSQAIDVLAEHRDSMSADDYGLAVALAGDPETGILVLDEAVRGAGSTARTRQNLAFAYAIEGRWLEAKIIAAQDINPANLESRMASWSGMISASNPQQRIAGLLGVTPAAVDEGQPARLALNGAAADAMAMADSTDVADAEPDAAVLAQALAVAEPAPAVDNIQTVAVAPSFTPAAQIPASADAPLIAADGIVYKSVPVIQPLRAAQPAKAPRTAAVKTAAAKPVAPKAMAMKSPAAKAFAAPAAMGSSSWVVQLGAYDNLGVAQTKWSALSRKYTKLASFTGKGTSAVVGGKSFVRLSASGFASQKDAMALCQSVKASGGTCLVRQMAKTETVRWASKGGADPVRMAAKSTKTPAKATLRVASR